MKNFYELTATFDDEDEEPHPHAIEDALNGFFEKAQGVKDFHCRSPDTSDDYPHTQEQYNRQVEWEARNAFEEVVEGDYGDGEDVHSIMRHVMEGNRLVDNYPEATIYWNNEGYDGAGHDLYIDDLTFDDGSEMKYALARAALYNDVVKKVQHIFELRDDLGEALKMIQGSLWSKGVEFEYEYEKGLQDPEYLNYTFTSLGEGEYRVTDPDDVDFEVISPMVHIAQSDNPIPEESFKLWLDNIIARRERECDRNEEQVNY